MAQVGHAASSSPRDSGLDGDKSGTVTLSDGIGENRFQQAIRAWRDVDLSSQIPQLDTAAADIINQQKEIISKRKELAQKTKDFRRMDESGKLGEIKGLLKLYQSFIDDVSNQSKTIQSAFLQLYTPLSEAPDPYPLLEASEDSMLAVEKTVPRLTQENERLQKSVQRLTTQLEERNKQADSERRLQKSAESSQMKKVKEIEDTWNTVLREKESSWDDERRALLQKNADQEKLIKDLKASNEVAHRLAQGGSQSHQGPGSSFAATAELEIISSELERTNTRVVELEKRNSQLASQLAQSVSQRPHQVDLEEEPSFVRIRSENQTLLNRLEILKEGRDQDRNNYETEIKDILHKLDAAKRDRDDFRLKLQKWKDYDVIKQELEFLKRIDFGISYDDQDEEKSNLEGGGNSKEDRLEQLLMGRNQKLSDELSDMRLFQQRVEKKLSDSEAKIATLTTDLEKARTLNRTLEMDLTKIQAEMEHSFNGPALSMMSGYASRPGHSRRNRANGRISPTSSIISGLHPSDGMLHEGASVSSPGVSSSGILPMVTAQRDRFKKQAEEFEAEIQRHQSTIQSLRSETEALRKDNMQLYEKNRYLVLRDGGKKSGGSSNPSVINMPSLSSAPASASVNGSLDRYRQAYESHISPFAAFRMNESARGMRRLSLPERILLGAVKFIVRDRLMCNLFAVYFILVHFFLFSWLFSGSGSGPAANVVGGTIPGSNLLSKGGEHGVKIKEGGK